jgi:hypothetical protein
MRRFLGSVHAPNPGRPHAASPAGRYAQCMDAERYGPLVIRRIVKEDGRVLLLFSRAPER